MATLDELIERREKLLKLRASGKKSTTIDCLTTEFKSDAEMKAALDDLDAQISRASGTTRVSQIRISTSKGL